MSSSFLVYLDHPLAQVALFLAASALMIWRLQAIESKGFEGTVVGTLIMPYCSGFANLVFAFMMSRTPGNGRTVIENCIVNNVTNLTLILGLTTLIFAPKAAPVKAAAGKARSKKKTPSVDRLHQLELLFTLVALFLFTGTLWALAKDGVLDLYDGLVLVGLFLFWQVLHVFEILKNNVRKNRQFQWSILLDLLLLAAGVYGIYISVDFLVQWVSTSKSAYLNASHLGWLSGVLMVLPNAFIAFYYGFVGRQDIIVSSQVGDGHICIPMCIGLFALSDKISIPGFFQAGIYTIAGAACLHFVCIATLGRLPRALGVVLLGGYVAFVYAGVVQ
ncbi:sodium:calcium symporter [Rhodoferax aquaticus]|uniref:Sodium:calcium symporter n=1 Tax=Rhodoferax aquaticus TaxID=2527691 RepID=A0A515ESQ4_9BURK|nr:sodium:calcium symporter [Rhodoferax aquaticus]QDL55658.1 sodium:calcium symporter [Rhodoferax aquaticus]